MPQLNAKDQLFTRKNIRRFEFDADVARVFDDMVLRSIPYYREINGIILDLIRRNTPNASRIYDLGCSTGTSLFLIGNLMRQLGRKAELIGIDHSAPMIKQASKKMGQNKLINVTLKCESIQDVQLEKCDVVVMNYTLQFLPPKNRKKLLQKIHKSLRPGGLFIMAEKILCNDTDFEQIVTDLYYDFKRRNGYSELEISRKRDALEKVLKPMKPSDHLKLLHTSGFKNSEMLFRWYNFATFVCRK